jgi:hypothetical protein
MITLTAKVSPGTTISKACKEAIQLADRVQCRIDFVFNDVKVSARPGAMPEELVIAWQRAIDSDSPYKYATT